MLRPLAALAGVLQVLPALAVTAPAPAVPSPGSLAEARAARLTCADAARCSPSAGLLSIINQNNETSRCTFALVGSHLVITNRHCVPDDLRKPGADCRNRLFLHFAPQKGHPAYESRAVCEKVLTTVNESKETINTPDIAVLKISPLKFRPGLPASREGLGDEEELIIDKVDHVEVRGASVAQQRQVRCRTVQNSHRHDYFTADWAGTGLLSDCDIEIQPGNSGAGVRDRHGRLRGVVSSMLFDKDPITGQTPPANERSPAPAALRSYGVATNLACLDLPAGLGLGPLPDICQEDLPPNPSARLWRRLIMDPIRDQHLDLLEARPARRWLRWKGVRREEYYVFEPVCVNADRVKLKEKAPVGPLGFSVTNSFDSAGRFLDGRVSLLEESGADLTVNPVYGPYEVIVGTKTYALKPCD